VLNTRAEIIKRFALMAGPVFGVSAIMACAWPRLGLPLQDAHVTIAPDDMGIGGTAWLQGNAAPLKDVSVMVSHLLRRISLEVAGVPAEDEWPPVIAAGPGPVTQKDYSQACGHLFSVAVMKPGPDAGNDILSATWKDAKPVEWLNATREASAILLRDTMVPSDAVGGIAPRRGLGMPHVEALTDRVLHYEQPPA
jgi:hypothetical protein